MTGAEVAAIILASSTFAGVVGNLWVQLRGQNEARAERAIAKVERMALSNKMEEVKTSTDGISDKLGAAKLAQGTAEGIAAGLAAGRAEGNGK
jgi:hypothetical protein